MFFFAGKLETSRRRQVVISHDTQKSFFFPDIFFQFTFLFFKKEKDEGDSNGGSMSSYSASVSLLLFSWIIEKK
jgi:hypothetical protein